MKYFVLELDLRGESDENEPQWHVRAFNDKADLATRISELITGEHYTGDRADFNVRQIEILPGNIEIKTLGVKFVDRDMDSNDYIYLNYELLDGTNVVERFYVTIDGRA